MKFDLNKWSFLTDLANTAFAAAFLTAWVICCAVVDLLLRIVGVSDLPGANVFDGDIDQNHGDFLSRYCGKQLLKSKTILTETPKALGI
ncbi:MAG: hypothetical protein ACR2N3_08190 [Pyrinomonadaceae bacterium]